MTSHSFLYCLIKTRYYIIENDDIKNLNKGGCMSDIKKISFVMVAAVLVIYCVNAMENPSKKENNDRFKFLSMLIENVYDKVLDFCFTNESTYDLVTNPTLFKKYLTVLKVSFKHSNLIDIKDNYLRLKKRYEKDNEKYQEVENAYENIMRMLLDIDDIGETDKGSFHNNILHLSYMSPREVESIVNKNELKDFFDLPKDASDNDVITAYNNYMQKYKEEMQRKENKINTLKAKLNMLKIPSQKAHQSSKSERALKESLVERRHLKRKIELHLAEKNDLTKSAEKLSEKYYQVYPKNNK